jgi:hypothetical protein
MHTVFWGFKDVVLINWLAPGQARHSTKLPSVKKLSSHLQPYFKQEGD